MPFSNDGDFSGFVIFLIVGFICFFSIVVSMAYGAITGLIERRPMTGLGRLNPASSYRDKFFDAEDVFSHSITLLFSAVILVLLCRLAIQTIRDSSD